MAKISATHPKAPSLIEAAARIKPNSPAFASLAFHGARLMIEASQKAEARKRLDALLASNGSSLPPSALNLFLSLRMKVATSLDDFLKYAQRVPSGTTFDEDGRELPAGTSLENKPKQSPRKQVTFDVDATQVLNEKMPLMLLKESATNKILPAHLRRDVAIAAWTRAVLLDDEDTARALVPVLEALAPELKEHLEAYLAADSKDAKKFSAVYLMLKFPGTRPVIDDGTGRETEIEKIDDYRDNWWCATEESKTGASTGSDAMGPKNPISNDAVGYTDFLSEAHTAAASAEMRRIAALGPAPNYLVAQAIKWANIKPDDPRAPEALHLAVRATRYGCKDEKTGSFSKQAYDALHRKYPRSAWAQKTKYWYKD